LALLFKPHRWKARKPVKRQRADGAVLPHGQAEVRMVQGQITPEKASVVFERYGIEMQNPYLALCEPADEKAHVVGGEIEWEGERFRIRSVQPFKLVGLADHVAIVLEQVGSA
jgi:hypothetical protein